jgi:hypothetical protein
VTLLARLPIIVWLVKEEVVKSECIDARSDTSQLAKFRALATRAIDTVDMLLAEDVPMEP